jgi:predicted PurR-regulated permease PerM
VPSTAVGVSWIFALRDYGDNLTSRFPHLLTLAALVTMGILLGLSGLILATPLTAIILALVKMIYVEGILEDAASVPR